MEDQKYRKLYLFFLILMLLSCNGTEDTKKLGEAFHGAPWLILELDRSRLLVSEVAKDLDEPWEIAWGPDDYLWLTEHKGSVKRINPATGKIKEVLSMPGVYYSRTPGLLGMALHPDFDTDPFVYFHHTYADSTITEIDHLGRSSNVRSKIVRYSYLPDKDTLSDPKTILPNIPGSGHHNGSRLTVSSDKNLFFP